MNYFKIYKTFFLFCCVFIFRNASAQLTVTPNQTAAVLASTLAGPGVTILTPTLTCPGVANGLFTSTGTLLAMTNGIVLTNGKASACVGPNGAPPGVASNNDGAPGDPALTIYLPAGTTTYDACILEFNMVTAGDSIGFNYQFGSQEYYHSTCGQYPDIFAFFISGPGIVGAPNIALVPGTNIPVEINSVNAGAAGGPGGLGPGVNITNCTSLGAGSPFTAYFINNWGGTQLSYTGFTTKFRAVHAVTPCDTYHLKLSIADADNAIYDSGVFLEANSLTPPSITAPPSICVGGTTTISSPIAGGTWSSSSTAIATIGATTGTATGVSGGSVTISYSLGAACILTTTLTVTALSPITGVANMCIGNSTTLSDAAAGGTWSSNNTSVATVNATTGVVSGVAVGTATITYSLPSGCSATRLVTVGPNPLAITGSTSACIGYTVDVSDATAGGVWTSSNTAIATISSSGVVSGLSAGTVTITYTSSGGCYVTAPIIVNTTYTSTQNTSICLGSTYTFAGTVYSTTGSYVHTFTTTTCDSIVTLNLTVNPPSHTTINDSICNGLSYTLGGTVYTTTGTYTYNTTNVYGCDSTVTLNLFVKPSPSAPAVVSPVTYCQGAAAIQLIATGTNLTWYNTSTGGTGSNTAPMPSTATAGITWYYVNQTVDGCTSPMDSIEVNVTPTPVASISANRITLCQFDTTLLTAGAVASGTYMWSAETGTNIISGMGTNQAIAQFNNLGEYWIDLTVGEGQCTSIDSIMIHVYPTPTANFYIKPDICIGDTIVVAISSITSGVNNCVWNFGDATIISATTQGTGGPYYLTYTDTGVHFIQMQAAVNGQCYSKPAIDSVNVHNIPDASFNITTQNGTLCIEDSVLFSANDSNYANNYSWTPVHFFGNNNIDKPTVWGKVELAQSFVTLTVTDPFGCTGSATRELDPNACCTLVFPNAFTPNGDGKDDIFRPITIGNYPIHTFMVANRWGQTVFETVEQHTGWDGTFNGVPQDIGVYFYYIKYDCNGRTIEEKGDVTLIR